MSTLLNYEIVSVPGDVWIRMKALVLNSVPSPLSKRLYARALTLFRDWYEAVPRGSLSKAMVQEYRSMLEASGYLPATVGAYITAVRRLAEEAADNGLLDPQIATAIARVRVSRRKGVPTGTWLTLPQIKRIIETPNPAILRESRDSALFAIAIGTGLRREELARLNVEDLQARGDHWIILDLIGKHNRIRTVPVPEWTISKLTQWLEAASISNGRIFRAIDKSDHLVSERISPQGIYEIVQTGAYRRLGFALSPHDLRRTFAKAAYSGGAMLDQIQFALGHASVRTTEQYLNLDQNLDDAPGTYISVAS
jgi:integrase